MGRYFWVEDALAEVDHHDRAASVAWNKVTGGNADDGSLLTLFLCVAAAAPPKTMLTEKSAATLVRKIRKSGFLPGLAHQYIADHAPVQHQDAYTRLWQDFVEEAQSAGATFQDGTTARVESRTTDGASVRLNDSLVRAKIVVQPTWAIPLGRGPW